MAELRVAIALFLKRDASIVVLNGQCAVISRSTKKQEILFLLGFYERGGIMQITGNNYWGVHNAATEIAIRKNNRFIILKGPSLGLWTAVFIPNEWGPTRAQERSSKRLPGQHTHPSS